MKQADIRKLGKYEILGELGKGAMGVVYKGRDPFIERDVALKTVRTDMLQADDPDATVAQITRFKREAQAAGRINHPNIVAIYEYGEDGPTAFIAMEFIEGRDLKDYFDAHERFDIKNIVRIMNETLSALDYAHKHGIVHRDIKPANIMMTVAGEVKITDFGIARLESSNLTQAGAVMGTPSYMSPEQFMGQQVDNRSDIFSAGAVFYQLLTGEKPFTGSLTTIMHRVLHGHPEAPSLLNVQIPRAFDPVVIKAMAKRPEDRYTTAAEFAQAVRDAAEGRLPPSPPDDDEADHTVMDDGSATVMLKARPIADEVMPARGLADEGARHDATVRLDTVGARQSSPPLKAMAAPPPASGGGNKGVLIGAVAGGVLVAGGVVGWLVLGSGSKPVPSVPEPPIHHEQPAPSVPPSLNETETEAEAEAARNQQAVAEARRQAEERARHQIEDEQVAEAKRQAEAQAAATVEAKRQAAAQAAATAEVKRQVEAQAAATAEAKRQVEAQAAATAEAKRQVEAQAAATVEAKRQAEAQAAATAEAKRQAEAQAAATVEAKRQAEIHRQELALTAVRNALTRAPCAILKADSGPDGTLMVTGAMGETGSDTALRTLIETAAAGVPYAVKVDTVSRPMCDPLAVVNRLRERNATLDQPVAVVPSNPGAIYKNGQNLILDVKAPGFLAYLQVDYFTLEGYVVHLLPNGLEKNHKFLAGDQRRLGDPTAGGRFWTVGQPFGRELIVVTASAKPLFPTLRPEGEPASGYLADLHKAVDAAGKGSGPAPVTTALFITTVLN